MLRFVDVRIDVKGWRQPPPVRTEHESVVAQMVVPVADGYIEDHPAEQLRQVLCRLSAVAVRAEELRQLEVACAPTPLL